MPPRPPPRRAPRPIRRFSSTVSWGKISRPWGTYPMPSRARFSGGCASRSAPSNRMAPDCTGMSPMTHLRRVVLPMPLRPHQAQAGPRRHVEVDVPQGAAAPVGLVEAADLEQAHAPRYTSMTRGSDCTASMPPSASTRPSCSTRHPPRDRPHELHVVLDDDHRVPPRERQQQLAGALGLLRGHARDRLVHQQQLRLLHQQHADLEPLLLAVGEGAGRGPAFRRQPGGLERLVDAARGPGKSGGRRRCARTTSRRRGRARGSRTR